jgi:multidrug efflux pump subunit AcrB
MATYPGASAETVADTVATPLEEYINGVENMIYMSASCSSDGQLRLAVTFAVGTDPDKAQDLVNNRVNQAQPVLPEEARRLGVTVRKRSPSIAMLVSLISPKGKYDPVYLSNYGYLHVQDVLRRLPGVGDTIIFGARDYSIRIWLDPNKVSARDLTASDVAAAVRRQNVEVAAGVFGQAPQPADNLFQLTARARGRLGTPEEFGDIILKTGTGGQITRLRDVARIELGAADYSIDSRLDGQPTAMIAVFQQPGANAVQTADNITRAMEELKKDFPDGLEYRIAFDTSSFIRESIRAVHPHPGHRGDDPGGAGRGVVPAELARFRHPAGRRAGFADWHICRHVGFRLLAQQPLPLRPGAGHWHCRGRRDCRCRECRTPHRRGAFAGGCDQEGDG